MKFKKIISSALSIAVMVSSMNITYALESGGNALK